MSSGYLGNTNLKRIAEQIEFAPENLQEYVKCMKDPIYFAENYIKIVHVDRGFIPFVMYDYQKEITNKITNNRRLAVLTARQSGKTTTAVAVILHYILFNEYKTVAILANKGDAAKEVLDRVKIAYEALPKWIQQGVEEWNKFNIVLENGCKIYAGTTSSSSIRGKSISFLYIDECITETNKVSVEICNEHYYYSEITDFINIDEHEFVEVKESGDMLYTIYKTTNKINDKQYIGFHKVKDKTDIVHTQSESGSIFRDGYMGSGKLIKFALIKYGPENFKQELLFTSTDAEEAFDLERELVDESYIERDDTYNISVGGSNCILMGGNNGFFGKHHTKESIEKIQKKRTETYNQNPFSWCEMYDAVTKKTFLCYDEVYDYYNMQDRDRVSIYLLVHYGTLNYKSEYLQNIANKKAEEYLDWISEAPKRYKEKARITSERFKNIPKTLESNIKRGDSLKKWISNNPDKHAERMNKINKNKDKIRKTAEKHTGMKRSEETRKKISEAVKGNPAHNKSKKLISNVDTGEIKYINKNEELPIGWQIGSNGALKTGPKGKSVYHNTITKQIKFFEQYDVPEGWLKGRK